MTIHRDGSEFIILPDSKRYAENEEEWNIILSRQNEIITDLLGANAKVYIVTGLYTENFHLTDEDESIYQPYILTELNSINLHQLKIDEYEEGQLFTPAFSETVWIPYQHDNLLRAIADFKTRCFFVSFDQNIIIAPYDGGVDFILKDPFTKDIYKTKYYGWLSTHPSEW